MAELKTKKNDSSVAEFIDSITDDIKRADSIKIDEIMQQVTGDKPKMWGSSIIGYGSYSYKTADGKEHDWMAIGFSPRKQQLTLYILGGFEEYAEFSGYNPRPLLDKLGKYTTGKSCLYIKKLDDIDATVLKKLIAQSYKAITTHPVQS